MFDINTVKKKSIERQIFLIIEGLILKLNILSAALVLQSSYNQGSNFMKFKTKVQKLGVTIVKNSA